MASGAQEPARGLAKSFAEYVNRQSRERGWTIEDVARGIGMSKTYTAKRMAGAMQFTVKDFEQFAVMVNLEPQEMLARVRLPEAWDYEGRLIPGYEVVATAAGKQVFLIEEPTPMRRGGSDNVVHARFGVGTTGQDLKEVASETIVERPEDTDDQY